MKPLLLGSTIIVLSLLSEAHAQNLKNEMPDYDPYVGTWVGSSSQDSLVVKLKKERYFFRPLNRYMFKLVGKYKYYKNNQLVNNNSEIQKETLLHGILTKLPTGKKCLNFTFKDLKRNQRGRLFLIFIDESQKVVKWKLRNVERIFVNEQKPDDWSEFSVPQKMILHKIDR